MVPEASRYYYRIKEAIYKITKTSVCYVTEKAAKPFGTNTLGPTHRDFRSPRRVVVLYIRLTD